MPPNQTIMSRMVMAMFMSLPNNEQENLACPCLHGEPCQKTLGRYHSHLLRSKNRIIADKNWSEEGHKS